MATIAVASTVAAAIDDQSHAEILRSVSNVGPESYDFAYETSNGINAHAAGQLKHFAPEQDAIVSNGGYGWSELDPETKKEIKFDVQYVADENGYQPTGAHLPTPPPIPVAIQRSLEWIRLHPSPEEQLRQQQSRLG